MVLWASTGTNKKTKKSPDPVRTWYSCKITYLILSLRLFYVADYKITYLTPFFLFENPFIPGNSHIRY